MRALISALVVISSIASVVQAISIGDVYRRLLEKERNIDNTFTFQFIKPIGTVAGEYIWPRTYEFPDELFFDENGASYNVRPRSSLHNIFTGNRISSNGIKSYNEKTVNYVGSELRSYTDSRPLNYRQKSYTFDKYGRLRYYRNF